MKHKQKPLPGPGDSWKNYNHVVMRATMSNENVTEKQAFSARIRITDADPRSQQEDNPPDLLRTLAFMTVAMSDFVKTAVNGDDDPQAAHRYFCKCLKEIPPGATGNKKTF
jgi:hypothetical protein